MTQLVNWIRISTLAAAALCLALLVGAAPAQAQAQQVTAEASVSWTLPTTDTLGDPLTGDSALQKVQVLVSTSSIPDSGAGATVIELTGTPATYEYSTQVPNGSTLYFRVAACNAICSVLSNQATKAIRVSVPGVPTGVTVTLRVVLDVGAQP